MSGRSAAAYPDRVMEWLFAVLMAAWGLYLLLPMTTFANPQYAVLARVAPEEVWGTLAMAIALVRMVALWINGAWRRTPIIRIACSVIGFNWWLIMIFLLMASGPSNPPAGLVWYPIFAVFEVVSCWRSAADAYHAKSFRFRSPRTHVR